MLGQYEDALMRAGEYVPETTYFDDRERRLCEEIARAQRDVEAANTKFDEMSKDLMARREAILDATATLRVMQVNLKARARDCRAAIQELTHLTDECDTLADSAGELLAEPLARLNQLDTEIQELERHRQRKITKPAHDVAKLEARLSRLRLRRALAEKAGQRAMAEKAGGAS